MPRHKKPKIKKLIPPHRRIPLEHGRLTATAKQLYDLIFSFGVAGCWMSNETITKKLDCYLRSVQRARKLLVNRELIVIVKTTLRTWMMWSRYHAGVKNCQVLSYLVRRKMDNPYYEIPPFSIGVSKSQNMGVNLTPKLVVDLSTIKSTVEGAAPLTASPSLDKESGTTPDEILSKPQRLDRQPAVQGWQWSPSEERFFYAHSHHEEQLKANGLTKHEANDMLRAEFEERFTSSEIFWLEELLQIGAHPFDAFDLVMEEREPGSVPWLNDREEPET